MAFSSLFTGLTAIKEDVKEPGQPLPAQRKRQRQGEDTGPQNKKRHNHNQFASLFKAPPDGGKAAYSNSRGRRYHCSDKAAHDLHFKGQKSKTVNIKNGNKQHECQEKKQWQKDPHQQRGRGRPVGRGGRHLGRPASGRGPGRWEHTNNRKDVQVKRILSMTPEFMDKNVLNVNGRMICRHFLWGRCVKGDDCQLEHVHGCNDFIKEACKYYIQGLCTKGASCPYMHQSFPCKFFHTKGQCHKGEDCRFSHQPLNDTTKELLDKFLLREQEMKELATKAEQKSLGLPESPGESEATEADKQPDILLPIRPNFYKSSDTNAEETEELSDNKLEEVTPSPSDQLCSAASTSPHHQQPVCYSVEAVLGTLALPLRPDFFKSSDTNAEKSEKLSDNKSEEVTPSPSDSAQLCSAPSPSPHHQPPVCYSVEAVLGTQLSKPFANYFTTPRSQESDTPSSPGYTAGSSSVNTLHTAGKSVGNSTLNPLPFSPAAQSASYVPISHSYLSLNSRIQNQKVSASENTVSRSQESSLKLSPGLDSQICPSLTSASGEQKKQDGNIPESLQTAPKAPHEVPVSIPRDTSLLNNSKRESFTPSGRAVHRNTFSRPPGETFSSKHLPFLIPPSKASWKPVRPSSGSTEVRHKVAAVSVPSCNGSKAKQPTDIRKKLSASEGVTKQHVSDAVAESSSKVAHCGESSAVCKKPPEIPFRSLFAVPITHTPQSLGSSVSHPSSVSESADSRRTPPKAAPERAPDRAPARPFLSLFSTPLTAAAAPLPQSQPEPDNTCSQQPDGKTTHSKQKTDSGTALPLQAASEVPQISHEPEATFPPDPVVTPVAKEQQLPEGPSHKGKEGPHVAHQHRAEAPATSVLKTLFLRLSPFREDGGIGEALEGEPMQHQEKKRKRKKKPKDRNSHKAAPSSPRIKGPQGKDAGSHDVPFQPGLKPTPQEGQRVNGSVTGSSLKDLFKNLDTSVSPFQH